MGEVTSSFWDRFDMIAVYPYTGHREERMNGLIREFKRVGILDRVEWFWAFPSPFTERFAQHVRLSPSVDSVEKFNSTMTYYYVLKSALETGKKNVLVLEDDVRFLSDLNLLGDVIAGLPEDYDVAKFEWNHRSGNLDDLKNSPRVGNGHWVKWPAWYGTYCTAASAYSHAGLKWKVDFMESAAKWTNLHSVLYMQDEYDLGQHLFRSRLNGYLSVPVSAIQFPYRRKMGVGVPRYHSIGIGLPADQYGSSENK